MFSKSIWAKALIIAFLFAPFSGSESEAASATCSTVHHKYASGVALGNYKNSGLPLLKKPAISSKSYRQYIALDTDFDGIACELSRELTPIERLESIVRLHELEKNYYEEAITREEAQRQVNQLPLTISLDEMFGRTESANLNRARLDAARRQVSLSTNLMTALDKSIDGLPTYPSRSSFPNDGPRAKLDCITIRRTYPYGVATQGAFPIHKMQIGYPRVSAKLYSKFRSLDSDQDGIACEVHRNLTSTERTRISLSKLKVEQDRIYSSTKIAELIPSYAQMERNYQVAVQYGETGDAMDRRLETMRYTRRWLTRQYWIMSEFDLLMPELPTR
jgi:hypothetical protein